MGSDKRKMLAKIRHKQRAAKVVYSYLEAQLAGIRYNQRPYKCPVCALWHLTSQKRRTS